MLTGRLLGVMQGRLLPKYKGRYQAHPKGRWQAEFSVAAEFGLDIIEFIVDFEDAEENPLLAPGGVAEIAREHRATGVGVRSICADYFMEAPLHHPGHAEAAFAVLERLIGSAKGLGVTDIVIPCVDQSSLGDGEGENADRLVAALGRALPSAEAAGVNLSLETDLAPAAFARLLERLPNPRVSVNYDIGNSASLGFDPREEFAAYGRRITDLHVKDRVRGGGSVELGTGDADIPLVFGLLDGIGFSGPIILQAFRDDEGLAVFRRQLGWLRDKVG